MRQISFGSYLKKQIIEMTSIERFQLSKLADLAERSERLRVPFLLYLLIKKTDEEIRAVLGETALAEYESVLSSVSDPIAEAKSLPVPYQRIIVGYERLSQMHKAENESKRLIAARIEQRRNGLGVSDYRICRELGINPGNFNAFFYHGHDNALSLDKVKLILKFVEFCRDRLL